MTPTPSQCGIKGCTLPSTHGDEPHSWEHPYHDAPQPSDAAVEQIARELAEEFEIALAPGWNRLYTESPRTPLLWDDIHPDAQARWLAVAKRVTAHTEAAVRKQLLDDQKAAAAVHDAAVKEQEAADDDEREIGREFLQAIKDREPDGGVWNESPVELYEEALEARDALTARLAAAEGERDTESRFLMCEAHRADKFYYGCVDCINRAIAMARSLRIERDTLKAALAQARQQSPPIS